MTVTPVLAMDSEFARCDNIGSGEVTQQILKKMLRCFKPLALDSDGRKGEAYQQCQSMEKGPSERDSWPRRKLECFRALVTAMSRHPNPERQPQYEMSYKHNCVLDTQHGRYEQTMNDYRITKAAKARCDAAKKAACQGKKGKKKAKCKKTWEAGLRVFMDGYESARPKGNGIKICIDGGGFIETDGTCCTRPLRGGGCTPGFHRGKDKDIGLK